MDSRMDKKGRQNKDDGIGGIRAMTDQMLEWQRQQQEQ